MLALNIRVNEVLWCSEDDLSEEVFPNLGLGKISPILESLPSPPQFRFSTTPGRVNAVRLSHRGPTLNLRHVKDEAKRAARRRAFGLHVATLYKRKADKVRPVDSDATDGQVPGGRDDWQERAWKRIECVAQSNEAANKKYRGVLVPRTARFPTGSRLTDERRQSLVVGDDVRPAERELLEQCLLNREAVLAWTFEEIGRLHEDVAPPQKIRTIPHEAWQASSFPIPRAIREKVAAKIQERVDAGIYERCEGPYRNPWFAVKKKNNDFRVVNAAMKINAKTVRDATLPPSADEFSEHMAEMVVASLPDLFSGYDQIPLDEGSRDLTAFHTLTHGLLRQTTLPQGATNSVGQFVRIILRVLERAPAQPYLDDVGIDGPKTDYDQEESEMLPGVRRFMLEHIMNVDKTLLAFECAGLTISGEKSQWLMAGLKVVGYVCDAGGRHPEVAKIMKIINWPEPTNASEVKGFLGLCVYYRIWVEGFATIARPMYALTKKDTPFEWNDDCRRAMNTLQEKITSAPALVTIQYGEEAGKVILVVDAGPDGWGAVLMQERVGTNGKVKRHPARYESGIWDGAERNYDQLKRECRGLLKALKKFRFWLYGVHFYVETDAKVLVAQLNRSVTDLPGAIVTQWMAWMRIFDFEIKHIDGAKNQAADALSRRPITDEDLEERENEEDIDEWIDAQISALRVCPTTIQSEPEDHDMDGVQVEGLPPSERVLSEEYTDDYEEIAVFLTNGMKRNPNHNRRQHKAFRSNALKYVVRSGSLFRREKGSDTMPKLVVCDPRRQSEIIRSLHDDAGHRGREGTYQRLRDRYFWEGMYAMARQYCKSCEECQKRQGLREHEQLTPTYTDHRWQKVGLDIVHMPKNKGKKYLVLARSDLSGWVEGRALSEASSHLIAQFLWEDVICRHGVFRKLVVDGGPENKGYVKYLANKYGIKRVVVSAYHPEANGMVERGHKPMVDALSKMTKGLMNWVEHLHAVLWADRTTVRRSTGRTPYEVEYAARPILPVELNVPTWAVMNWDEVKDTSDLLAVRARVLERRDEDIAEVAAYLRRMREANKDDFDARMRTRSERLRPGQLVLLRNTKADVDMSREQKLAFHWLGPYVVRDVVEEKGTYLLAEIGENGPLLQGTFAGNRLRPFTQRQPAAADDDVVVEIQPITEEDFREAGPPNPTGQSESSKVLGNENVESSADTSSADSNEEDESDNQEVIQRRREGRYARRGRGRGRGSGLLRLSTRGKSGAQGRGTRGASGIVVNIPRLPDDHEEYEVLHVRGRGRPRKVLTVAEETVE